MSISVDCIDEVVRLECWPASLFRTGWPDTPWAEKAKLSYSTTEAKAEAKEVRG